MGHEYIQAFYSIWLDYNYWSYITERLSNDSDTAIWVGVFTDNISHFVRSEAVDLNEK